MFYRVHFIELPFTKKGPLVEFLFFILLNIGRIMLETMMSDLPRTRHEYDRYTDFTQENEVSDMIGEGYVAYFEVFSHYLLEDNIAPH